MATHAKVGNALPPTPPNDCVAYQACPPTVSCLSVRGGLGVAGVPSSLLGQLARDDLHGPGPAGLLQQSLTHIMQQLGTLAGDFAVSLQAVNIDGGVRGRLSVTVRPLTALRVGWRAGC
jgi:hypothetical protein